MATYYFCTGFTATSVTVTANFGYCTDYREYTDEYCHYRTWSRNITFTFSGDHPAMNIRFRYYQVYQQNGSTTWEGWITAVVPIPAHVLTYTYEQDCHEERYCNFTDGLTPSGGDYPTPV